MPGQLRAGPPQGRAGSLTCRMPHDAHRQQELQGLQGKLVPATLLTEPTATAMSGLPMQSCNTWVFPLGLDPQALIQVCLSIPLRCCRE